MDRRTRDLLLMMLTLPLAAAGCAADGAESGPENEDGADIGPARQCQWVYHEEGLDRFKNAALDPGFDPKFNMHATVSRQGLTGRIVGTLSDDFMDRHDNDMARVVENFPYLTPISQTSIHTSVKEDRNLAPKNRERRGEVTNTEIIDLPENSVMIVYPVSVADRGAGWNTLAGNWLFDGKTRQKHSKKGAAFGKFPFLLYTGNNGHAFHGPITKNNDRDAWRLKRGEVSHGCNRMQGEHVVELSVLAACGKDPADALCPDPDPNSDLDDEHVTVLEDFDIIPDPNKTHAAGAVNSWDTIFEDWVAVDVDYPRFTAFPENFVGDVEDSVLIRHTEIDRSARADGGKPAARLHAYPTWDNMATERVTGRACN